MITCAAPFLTVLLALPLAWAWSLTPTTIDNHMCKPEKLKNQARYICDTTGKVECLTGWKDKDYNKDPHFPCAEPICNPKCENGECKLPNICSCEIGWDGLDCGTCIDMPGCVNGGCSKTFEDGTQEVDALSCKCHDNWQGALCDTPKCQDNCNNHGKCVDIAGDEHECKCNLGWTGEYCDECEPLMGCKIEHTIDVNDDTIGDGCKIKDADDKIALLPNTCQCTDDWTGIFCEQPKCRDDEDGSEISCVNGECTQGGTDPNGQILPAFCKCRVGWAGNKCDQCVPHPQCPNTPGSSLIAACINPNDCRCEGTLADNDEETKYCFTWIETGACEANADCAEGQVCEVTDGEGSCV